jgi:hypothetical protein
MIFQSNGNAIQICDSTTGHSVKNIAFCDTDHRAKDIVNCYNAHNDLVDMVANLAQIVYTQNGNQTESITKLLEDARQLLLKAWVV